MAITISMRLLCIIVHKDFLCPGTAKSEKALVSLFEAQRELKEEMDTSKTLRMERVKAKLATVMVRLSLDRLF